MYNHLHKILALLFFLVLLCVMSVMYSVLSKRETGRPTTEDIFYTAGVDVPTGHRGFLHSKDTGRWLPHGPFARNSAVFMPERTFSRPRFFRKYGSKGKSHVYDGKGLACVYDLIDRRHSGRTVMDRKAAAGGKRENVPSSIALVIDDLGYNTRNLDLYMDCPVPLTLAVLPGLYHTEKISSEAEEKGVETILHMPMEPRSFP